jgi:hypothetical protein
VEQRRYDLVHIQTPFVAPCAGLGIARRLRAPMVESYHTFFEQHLGKVQPALSGSGDRAASQDALAEADRDGLMGHRCRDAFAHNGRGHS